MPFTLISPRKPYLTACILSVIFDCNQSDLANGGKIFGIPLTIALGKSKNKFINENVIYFPIYLVKDDQMIVVTCIANNLNKFGIIEEKDKFSVYIRKDKDVLPWKDFNKNMAVSVEYNLEY